MLMSIRSAPASAATAAAERITSASWPKSWIETGCSSGWIRISSRRVRSLRWCRPKLETTSETARPAPCRFACRRTNQLPIPARGASRTRLGISMPPIRRGSVSGGCGGVALMDQSQPFESKEVVDFVDRLREGDDGGGVATGGDNPRIRQLLFDPAHDAVDQPGEAKDEAGVDRRPG